METTVFATFKKMIMIRKMWLTWKKFISQIFFCQIVKVMKFVNDMAEKRV